MKAGPGPLLSTLLGLLLLSMPGTRGANPALVARITDKGLAYGKKPNIGWPKRRDTRNGLGVESIIVPRVGSLLYGCVTMAGTWLVTLQMCDLST